MDHLMPVLMATGMAEMVKEVHHHHPSTLAVLLHRLLLPTSIHPARRLLIPLLRRLQSLIITHTRVNHHHPLTMVPIISAARATITLEDRRRTTEGAAEEAMGQGEDTTIALTVHPIPLPSPSISMP
jgi:hypothetical protein